MEPSDLDAMFDAPQITTDEHGIHRDETGRRYLAINRDGELTFIPEDEA
jgi:hypothetical protein